MEFHLLFGRMCNWSIVGLVWRDGFAGFFHKDGSFGGGDERASSRPSSIASPARLRGVKIWKGESRVAWLIHEGVDDKEGGYMVSKLISELLVLSSKSLEARKKMRKWCACEEV